MFTNVDNNWDEWLENVRASATDSPISIVPANPSQGDTAYNGVVKEASIKRAVTIKDIVGIEANYQIDGHLGRGIAVAYQLALQGTFTGTGYNIGAASATQMWLVTVHCMDVSGGGGPYTIRLQESSDDGATDPYVNVAGASWGMTQGGTSNFAAALINGPREAWVRVTGTQNASETATFVVCVSIVDLQ